VGASVAFQDRFHCPLQHAATFSPAKGKALEKACHRRYRDRYSATEAPASTKTTGNRTRSGRLEQVGRRAPGPGLIRFPFLLHE